MGIAFFFVTFVSTFYASKTETLSGKFKKTGASPLRGLRQSVRFLSESALPSSLEILPYRKLILIDEDLLESIKVVLLIEDKHGFLVVNRID